MRELAVELKQLRMHGMAGAWADLVEQGGGGSGGAAIEGSRWRLDQARHAGQVGRRDRTDDAQFQPVRLFETASAAPRPPCAVSMRQGAPAVDAPDRRPAVRLMTSNRMR